MLIGLLESSIGLCSMGIVLYLTIVQKIYVAVTFGWHYSSYCNSVYFIIVSLFQIYISRKVWVIFILSCFYGIPTAGRSSPHHLKYTFKTRSE